MVVFQSFIKRIVLSRIYRSGKRLILNEGLFNKILIHRR